MNKVILGPASKFLIRDELGTCTVKHFFKSYTTSWKLNFRFSICNIIFFAVFYRSDHFYVKIISKLAFTKCHIQDRVYIIYFLYSITVGSAAPQTTLWEGPMPRFEPGTSGLEAEKQTTRQPHLRRHFSYWYAVSNYGNSVEQR